MDDRVAKTGNVNLETVADGFLRNVDNVVTIRTVSPVIGVRIEYALATEY